MARYMSSVVVAAVAWSLAMTSIVAADTSINSPRLHGELRDLYYGEALFYAYQGRYFDAISRLDTELAQYYDLDEPELNSLYYHIDNAEFSVGDFELYYRMHDRAGRVIRAVIETNVDETLRNDAVYRLAKLYYQRQEPLEALKAIERLNGEVSGYLRYEARFLRARIYMATGKFNEAISILKGIEGAEDLDGYVGYNLAVALLKSGREQEGISQLDKVGRSASADDEVRAIQDKANLVLGFRLLEADKPAQARQYLQRVRLEGPFSNKALLGAGWAAAATGSYRRALVPWTMLSRRNVTDKPVQEVLLGLPYAYGKLDVYGKAAVLYGQALESYSRELKRLDDSIASIRRGKFLDAVIREQQGKDKRWLVNLRNLPDTPETYYLTQMMASHDFQESLKNYSDLSELQKRLAGWEDWLRAYESMIAKRSAYYEPILPGIGNRFRHLDSRIKLRTEQRDRIARRLQAMLVSPRPDFLVTSDERLTLQRIGRLEKTAVSKKNDVSRIRHRIDRLKGIITWSIDAEYQDRFTRAVEHLHDLDRYIEDMRRLYDSFVRTRQAATQSYKGYDNQIERLRIKIRHAGEKLKVLLARQGHVINVMAINELNQRRRRIEEYQIKARFAMAESYDRATKTKQEQKKESHGK